MSSQIHDLGYRSYEGERAGVSWAVRSLAVHSMRRALGLKRAGKHKIVPIIAFALAYVPAIIIAGAAVLLSDFGVENLVPYGDYYLWFYFALFLFTAASAPGVLTTDRTSGMLAMYLASPLNRTTYVLAKAIGIFAVMLMVTLGPVVFLILANTFVGVGPGGVVDFLKVIARALFGGGLAAAFYTGLGMFVSSIPRRWGIASVAIVAALIVPTIVVVILIEAAEAPDWTLLLSPADTLAGAWQHIFGEPTNDLDVPGWQLVLAAFGYAAAGLGLSWYRYQTIEVDR